MNSKRRKDVAASKSRPVVSEMSAKPSGAGSKSTARNSSTSRPGAFSAIGDRLSAIASSRWAQVRLFAMDVDCVLTDGTEQISSDGTEAKSFSILDGMGLKQLERAGIITAWISGRASGATTVR